MKKIIFIGAGYMAEALIQGWIKKEVLTPQEIYVINRSDKERLQFLTQTYGIHSEFDESTYQQADIIILAMKPKDAVEAMQALQPKLAAHTTILSVLAGTSIETITHYLGDRPVARVMPNTSATIGMSASGIAFNEQISATQRTQFLQLLAAIGEVIEVEEDQLHAVTALSGSGPAYIYYLMEAFERVGTQVGLSKDTVRLLMTQTLAGTAEMLKQSVEEPTVLRRKVTSPGGTTEAGINALELHQFQAAIEACIKEAEARSRSLAKHS
ncbi:pyrroline-5-carboxylate reductase [Lysinibacillus piscis]|uniref:Pyrroline-5-carboxylate reductase n=1 Tax=Lysinibacillus piscis TaxID=2518931 RepID=A0ABQ5NLJ3_9BACI|nr:pyrroline-5-carboxylate reductase [Lysinibacillus sp. KH24]GLC89231.1 pyrroline-5-carboxylate reductase 2 [Lysinibacillus sp. KH24]